MTVWMSPFLVKKFGNKKLKMSKFRENMKKKMCLKILLETELDSSNDEESDIPSFCGDYKLINVCVLFPNTRTCIRGYVENVVLNYSDYEFKMHFRISRSLFHTLLDRFEGYEFFKNLREDKRFSASKHLLVFLWFAGHEACSYRDLADRFDSSLSTVHVIITRVISFLSSMSDEVICWPTAEQMENSSSYFEEQNRFSKVFGAIDGTHIQIDPPKIGKDDYIDRKGDVTITLQAICNENRKFIDIFVGFPGSVHDSRVFQNSFVCPTISSSCKDYFILGDSAYPLMVNLLTPFKDNGHLTSAQKYYNKKLSSCRVKIEHSFGILKQRFRQLYYCKLKGMEKLCHFVRACCVLHNLASETDFNFNLETDDEMLSEPCETQPAGSAKLVRNSVCEQLWLNRNM